MRNAAKSVIFCLAVVGACSGQRSEEFDETLDGGDGDIGSGDAGVDASSPGDGEADDAATPDAGEPDSGPVVLEGVRVTILAGGAPYPGARIVASGDDGGVLEVLTADATGLVQISTAAASFTLLAPVDDDTILDGGPLTYFGIEDGDALTIDVQTDEFAPVAGSYSVQLPGAYPDAVRYILNAGSIECVEFVQAAALTAPVSVSLYEGCLGETVDLLAVAVDGNSTPIAFSSLLDVAPPAPDQVVNLTMTAWTAAATLELSYEGVPEHGESSASVSLSREGQTFFIGGELSGAIGRTQSMNVPSGFFDRMELSVRSNEQAQRRAYYSQSIHAAFASPFAIDPNDVLGPPDPSVFDTTDRLDLGRGLPAEADFAVIDIDVPVQFAEFTTNVLWTFVAPPQYMPAVIPALPEDAGFTRAEGALQIAGVSGVDVDGLDGFAAFKASTMLYDSYVEGNTVEPTRTFPSVLRRTALSP